MLDFINIKTYKMDNLNKVKHLAVIIGLVFLLSGCDDLEPKFTGQISGRILDQNGNIVSGDVTSDDLLVLALGTEDTQEMRIRVLGDGTYTNTNLYAQTYDVWVTGAITAPEKVTLDLRKGPVKHDIIVTPFFTIPPPTLVGNPSSTEVTISYSITGNLGHIAEERAIFVSTVSYPSRNTGSGAEWTTIRKNVTEDSGNVTIGGLKSGTNYFVRVTAHAQGSTRWNLSDQIKFTTP